MALTIFPLVVYCSKQGIQPEDQRTNLETKQRLGSERQIYSTKEKNSTQEKVKLKAVSDEKFGFQLIKKRKITRIPFEFQANLVIVPVKVNNSDTLRFILDTGVSSIILTDANIVKQQHMKFIRNVSIAGVGEGNNIEAGIVLENTITMGDMIGYRQNLVVIKDDVLKLSEFVGRPIHGIIGYEIFNRFAVTIDFSTNELILQNPESYKYKPNKGERFPITIEENKPYLSTIELVNDNQNLPLKVILDTGAGHAISLDANQKNSIPMPEKIVKAQLGRGLSGIINGNLGRIPMLKIGKFEIKNLVASFPDSASYRIRGIDITERQGNIGCEFLRRFKVTFNYRDQYIVLKPINRRMKEPFEHNMSGIELMARGEDYHEFMVDRVIENSPAELAGLQQGDRVIFINNKSSKDVTISEIYKIFQKGEGKPINLMVKRGNEIFFTTVNLRRLI
ncbi:aspartyl protease family protein [Arcicella aurantiaca]|nr:aspartyl protease family protein [Arcicella aurantiaca]